jgi:hypothetical protein
LLLPGGGQNRISGEGNQFFHPAGFNRDREHPRAHAAPPFSSQPWQAASTVTYIRYLGRRQEPQGFPKLLERGYLDVGLTFGQNAIPIRGPPRDVWFETPIAPRVGSGADPKDQTPT